MTELILKIAEMIYSNPSAYTQDKAIERATKIIALTEQYYREAGYKSPYEVKSLVFNAILYADDKQKEAICAGYKNCNQCDATNVKREANHDRRRVEGTLIGNNS